MKGAVVTVVQTSGSTVASPVTAATKTLTPTQLQYFRQQALVKQQQQRLQEQQQLKKLQLASGAAGSTSPAGATTPGQKGTTAVTTITTSATGLTSFNNVQIAGQGQQGVRTQILKGGTATALLSKGGGAVARAIVTDTEMAALIKRQQQLQHHKSTNAAGAAGNQQQTVQIGSTAQLLAQAGIQVQSSATSGSQVAALVKTVSAPGSVGGAPSVTIPVTAISVGLPQVQVKGLSTSVKAGTATQQQLRQFTIQHQLIQQRKSQQQQAKTSQLAQAVTLGTVKGNVVGVPGQQLSTAVGTVQLVQPVGSSGGSAVGGSTVGGSKPTTVTMQQLQQVIRQVTAGNAQVLVSSPNSGGMASGSSATALLTKAPQGQTVQARVIPVSQQGLKQTIQVVTTGQPGSGGSGTRVTASASGMAPGLASALAAGTWKVAGGTDAQQKALLSQVSAALQSGQPVSLAVRAGPNSASGTTTRILTAGTAFTTASTTATVSVTTTASSAAVAKSSEPAEPSADSS